MLVVGHHSMLAYAWYAHFDADHYLRSSAPVVDTQRWLGIDIVVLFNDAYFMSLMFLLSGLFLPQGVASGAAKFLRRRWVRLGVPFLFMIFVLVPIAYYPSIELSRTPVSLAQFWWDCIRHGPWPGGPAWFLWVLCLFDTLACGILCRVGLSEGLRARARSLCRRPMVLFAVLIALSMLAYLPMVDRFGMSPWLAVGPFSVQTSRILLYATYFGVGVCIGLAELPGTLFGRDGPLARAWPQWALLALAAFGVILALQLAREGLVQQLGARGWTLVYAPFFCLSCAASSWALLSAVVRFGGSRSAFNDRMSAGAYGVFIVHYGLVTWIQYLLLPRILPAAAKAALVWGLALALSYGITFVVRRHRVVARIV